jgi:hypothetical protein
MKEKREEKKLANMGCNDIKKHKYRGMTHSERMKDYR